MCKIVDFSLSFGQKKSKSGIAMSYAFLTSKNDLLAHKNLIYIFFSDIFQLFLTFWPIFDQLFALPKKIFLYTTKKILRKIPTFLDKKWSYFLPNEYFLLRVFLNYSHSLHLSKKHLFSLRYNLQNRLSNLGTIAHIKK